MVARANAARVTLHPLDARGSTTNSSADISLQDRDYVPTAMNDMVRRSNLAAPLQLLADETGGFAMRNGLDPKTAMKYFDADEEGHYLLGFVPGEADGRIHRLSARLNDKSESRHHADIRHRQTYLRAELPARRGQRSLATLMFGLEENELNAHASVERAVVRPGAHLPTHELAQSVARHRWKQARVQVVISLRPARSQRSLLTVREEELTLSLSPETPAPDGARREIIVQVTVGEGEYEFAIGIEDVATGSSAYMRRTLDPG